MSAMTEEPGGESHIMRVSVRAWIVMLLVVTLCIMSGLGIQVSEPLYTVVTVAVGYYFGQKKAPTS